MNFASSFMENIRVKRKKPSALPSILSLASVMFILGLLGVSIIGFNGLGRYWLENSSVDVYFHSDVSEEYVKDFQKQMEKKTWVRDVQYVSKEQAVKEMGEKYDPNFMSYVETVSLPLSIEIYPKAEYANTKFLSDISHFFKQNTKVEDVIFQENWLTSITANLKRVQYFFGGFALIMIIVSIILIQSSVRLGIFANRHTIKSMQLVGATNGFIIRPFVSKFIGYSMIAFPMAGGFIAAIFWGLPYWMKGELKMLNSFNQHIDLNLLGILSISIAIFGIVLATLTSWISTRKFLKTKIENLY